MQDAGEEKEREPSLYTYLFGVFCTPPCLHTSKTKIARKKRATFPDRRGRFGLVSAHWEGVKVNLNPNPSQNLVNRQTLPKRQGSGLI